MTTPTTFAVLIVVLTLATCGVGGQQGLVAHYPFDEGSGSVALDTTGNGHDGKIHGAQYVAVETGYALQFDGDDDYVEIPNSDGLKLSGTLTVELWANSRFESTGALISKTGCGANRLNYGIALQDNGILFQLVKCPSVEKGALGPRIAADAWQHIVGTYDGNAIKVYLNGALVSTTNTGPFEVGTDDDPLCIGVNQYGNKLNSYFSGQIDDVRIYHRALPAQEILANYHGGKDVRISTLSAISRQLSAFETADTTPPTVTQAAPAPDSRVSRGAIISAKFTDTGSGIDVASAKILLDGGDVTAEATITPGGIRFRPARLLAKGVHRVEVSVSDGAGNRCNRMNWLFGVDTDVSVEAKFEHGVLLVNGEPYFPMGIYCGSVSPGREDLGYLAQAAEAGINYKLEGQSLGPEMLDAYLKIGMKALKFMGFAASALANGDQSQLDDVLKTKDHPGMLGWWAEFDSSFHENVVAPMYRALKSKDPNHPVIFMHTWAGPHTDAYYIYDYPILNPLREREDDVIGGGINSAIEAAAAEGKNKPVWYISQAFDYRIKAGKIATLDGGFRPSREEIRAMNYYALTVGARGLLYYSPGIEIPDTPYCDDLASYPRQWTEALKIAREVRHLTPELAAGRTANSARLQDGNPAIHYRQISHKGTQTLIAVNVKRDLTLAKWVFDTPAQLKVLFEDRIMTSEERIVSDLFKPLEVHIYQWKTPHSHTDSH